jgi:predicted acyltransferase
MLTAANGIPQTTSTRAPRLQSLDVMRGITVAFMIMVNNNGQNDLAYRAMNHSPWNGFTPTDLVFPAFLFVMGVSVVLSLGGRRARAPKGTALLHVLRRFVILVLLGLIVNGFPYFHLETLRIYGVLQRIAVCYLLASLLELATSHIAPRVLLFVAALVGYWALMRWVPVPGYGLPGRDIPLLDPDRNLVAYIDRHIFPGRLFEGTRDPEGLLSDIPSFASTLMGMMTGWFLKRARPAWSTFGVLLVSGLLSIIAGLLWAQSFPLNKKLWTSSYVLYAGGWSLILFAACYLLCEIWQWRGSWTHPWLAFGTNAITAYFLSELLSSAVADFHVNARQSIQQFIYSDFFYRIGSPAFGSLLYSIAFAGICWVVVWLLYRRGIFIKL